MPGHKDCITPCTVFLEISLYMYKSVHAYCLSIIANPESEFIIGARILGLNKVSVECFEPGFLFSRDILMLYQISLSYFMFEKALRYFCYISIIG